MSSYATTASNTPVSVAGSMIPPSSVDSTGTGPTDTTAAEADTISLEEREAQLQALLTESQATHAELSERMMDVYEKQTEKLHTLRIMEKTLSSQAGSLLKRLQSEEQSTSQLSSIIKRYKSEHKKLLAKIANPKWEIAHHYHMTCIEHQLGHRQPHVLDVAELLPGHLRIYSLARVSSLYKRALMYYSAKSKSDRNSVSESIQESYKRLREVRKDMKEIQKLMDLMKVHMKRSSIENKESGGGGAGVRIPLMQRQDSGERTFDPTTPVSEMTSPIAAAARSDDASFAPSPSASIPPSATRRPPPQSSAGGGPGGPDALLRQRRRMLGMGGPAGPGQSSRGPGMSGRPGSASSPSAQGQQQQFMGSGTPITGTTSEGTTGPGDPLAPLNPDAIVLPTDGAAFTPLSVATQSPGSSSLASSTSSTSASTPSSSSSSQSNYRMKYFKTLNLAPKLDFLSSHLPSTSPAEQKKDMAESYNMDMKNIHQLLSSLEATGKASKEKAQQLTMLQQYRKRMGVESLPQPHFDAAGQMGALDAPQSPSVTGFGTDADSDTEGGSEFSRRGAASPLTLNSPGASPALSPYSPVGAPDEFVLDSLTSPATSPTASGHTDPTSPSGFGRDMVVPVSKPMAIESRSSSLSTASSARDGHTASSSGSSSSSRDRSRDRERERRKPSAISTAAANAAPVTPPVTLFSSRGAGGGKAPGATGGSESQPQSHSHPGERQRSHSSRAISSRGLATNRAEEHGR